MTPKAKKTTKRKRMPENAALAIDEQNTFDKSVRKLKSKQKEENGYCYVGHLPRGFEEKQLKNYFKEFGNIKRLRLCRSKKTGNPKGYAFVEFESEYSAIKAAEATNNYIMFNRLLKCEFIKDVHPNTFAGKTFAPSKAHLRAVAEHDSVESEQQHTKRMSKLMKRKQSTMKRLAQSGVEYSYEQDDADMSNTSLMTSMYEDAVSFIRDQESEDEVDFKTPPKSSRRQQTSEDMPEEPKAKKAKAADGHMEEDTDSGVSDDDDEGEDKPLRTTRSYPLPKAAISKTTTSKPTQKTRKRSKGKKTMSRLRT